MPPLVTPLRICLNQPCSLLSSQYRGIRTQVSLFVEFKRGILTRGKIRREHKRNFLFCGRCHDHGFREYIWRVPLPRTGSRENGATVRNRIDMRPCKIRVCACQPIIKSRVDTQPERVFSFTDSASHACRAVTFNKVWTRATVPAAVALAHTEWMRNRRRYSRHLSVPMNKTRR